MATKKAKTPAKKTTKKATTDKKSTVHSSVTKTPEKVQNSTTQATESPTQEKTTSFRFKKSYAIVILIGVLSIALLYVLRSYFTVATVNGKPISRIILIQELEKQSGKQALESMITKELITQEAEKNNVTVTDQDIDAEIKKIDDNLKKQGQSLDQVLSPQNLTRESPRDQVRIQKAVEKILGNKIQVSDKEVDDYIASNSAQLPQDADQKQLRTQITQDLRQQKLSEQFQLWLSALRQKANVEYLVTY